MADDGMIMNFDLGNSPLVAKAAFKGGRWRDRLTAKKVQQYQQKRILEGPRPHQPAPAAREILNPNRVPIAKREEYIGPSEQDRGPKRQRISTYREVQGRNEHSASVISGKLPAGSVNLSARSPATRIFAEAESDHAGNSTTTGVQAKTYIAGKLPAGSINTSGSNPKKKTFADDVEIEMDSIARPVQQSNGVHVKTYIAGKLPPGSINTGIRKSAKKTFDEDISTFIPATTHTPAHTANTSVTSSARQPLANGSKPAQIISSLFTFNPEAKSEPEKTEVIADAVPSNAPLSDEATTFANMGVSRRLAVHLAEKLEMKAPTGIQKAAIPQLIGNDSDAFIQAETGSGKTLSYLLPIVERIMALSTNEAGEKIDRKSGLFAIVLAPTRELCKQISTVLEKLLGCAHWLVGTTVMGGEGKQSEKARLRRGVNILIATPGRLVDHLDNTEVLNVSTVRWLVLDEGDRLMEMGFEEEVKSIVENIGRRALSGIVANKGVKNGLPSRRVTILCSATMKMTAQKLGEVSLKDAVHIVADPSDEPVSNNNAGTAITEEAAFSAPAQLKQAYGLVPAKLRLVTLIALLRRTFARRGSVMKAIVFMSCADTVDFHFTLLSSQLASVALNTTDESQAITPPAVPASDLTKDTVAWASIIAPADPSTPVLLHKLHGSLSQPIRSGTLASFSKTTTPSIMICTDVASRGLDLPNIDLVIEYDPPFSKEDHLHRVGRTARAGHAGRALIFLQPGPEEGYISILASGYKLSTRALTRHTAADLLAKGFGGVGTSYEEKATTLQLQLEQAILASPKLLEMARRGFQSHVRAYATHVAAERSMFDLSQLHLGHLAKAFALRDAPGNMKVPGSRPGKVTTADRKVAERKKARAAKDAAAGKTVDAATGAGDKAPEGERERKKRLKARDEVRTVDGDDAAKRMKRKMMEHMAGAAEFNIG